MQGSDQGLRIAFQLARHRSPAVEKPHVLMRFARFGRSVPRRHGVKRSAIGIGQIDDCRHERVGCGLPTFLIGVGEDKFALVVEEDF